MTALRSGELFAGVGGLGMAVDEVFGSSPAWFAEFDQAPSKVLAHRYPDVPNFGDVTKLIDPPRVDILAGGFPCQDVSLAGARRGMKNGTRSGLWSEYARIIDEVRPDWVVIENVRGLISARADSEVESCPWCVGDGDDEYHLRALDAVLADLAALGFDAEWTGLRAADVGAPHGRFRFFILAWPAEHTVSVTRGWRSDVGAAVGRPGLGTSALLPTPVVTDSKGARNATAGRKKGSQHHGGTTLTDAVALLPTPRTTDMSGPGHHGEGGMDPRTAATLLPTPTAKLAEGSQTHRSGARSDELLLGGTLLDVGRKADWGPYGPAVNRWGGIIGRSAPAPVRMDGKGGKPRLNPELTEWMMGWPDGWITDPAIGLTRAEQLKACGNGVVPQQAAAALRELLARPGVPSIRQDVNV